MAYENPTSLPPPNGSGSLIRDHPQTPLGETNHLREIERDGSIQVEDGVQGFFRGGVGECGDPWPALAPYGARKMPTPQRSGAVSIRRHKPVLGVEVWNTVEKHKKLPFTAAIIRTAR